jgi:Fe-S cluster assembly iron-binding protein IscA
LENAMLTVTEQAASMIRELFDQANLPDHAGLRIARRDDHTALATTLADAPRPDDLIVAERDVAVVVAHWLLAVSGPRPQTRTPPTRARRSLCGTDPAVTV